MFAVGHHAAFVEYDDAVGELEGTEPVSDEQGGFPFDELPHGFLDFFLVFRVQGGGGLVEDEDGSVL